MHVIAPLLSGTPGQWRRLAPGPGEHTDDILRELGLGADEIAELRRSGSVR